MKKISLAVFAMMMVAMLAVFAGCSSSSDTNSGTADSGTAQDNSLQNVLDKGTLVLGLDDSFPPMGFRDENNNIVGFDIDVATEVANRMGVELKLQPIEWSTKEMELNTGSVDCLWNGLSIDDERKQAMDLSEPYAEVVVMVDVGGVGEREPSEVARCFVRDDDGGGRLFAFESKTFQLLL